MPVYVKIDLKSDALNLKDFSAQQIAKSAASAINHTLAKVRTEAIRSVTAQYNISRPVAADAIKIQKTSAAYLDGRLTSTTRTLPLIDFKAKEVKSGVKTFFAGSTKTGGFVSQKTREKTEGVSVEILKGDRKLIPSAFIYFGTNRTQPSVKAYGLYSESGFGFSEAGDEPASKLKSVSIAGALRNDQLLRKLKEKAQNDYNVRLVHELTKGNKYKPFP